MSPVNTNTQPRTPPPPVPLVLTACVRIAGRCWIQTGRGTQVLWGLGGLAANLHPGLLYTSNPAHHTCPTRSLGHRSEPQPRTGGGCRGSGRARGDWRKFVSSASTYVNEVSDVSTSSPEVLLREVRAAVSGPAGEAVAFVPKEWFLPPAPAVSVCGAEFSGAPEAAWLLPGV